MARSVIAGLVIIAAGGVLLWRSCQQSESRAVLERWLAQSCSAGEAEDGEAGLRAQGRRLEDELIDAFQQGPSPAELDSLLEAAGQDYDEVQAALNAGKTYGLPPEEVAAIRAISKAEYLAERRDAYQFDYRAATVDGLGTTGGAKGRDVLRRTAADPRSPHRGGAEAALKKRVP